VQRELCGLADDPAQHEQAQHRKPRLRPEAEERLDARLARTRGDGLLGEFRKAVEGLRALEGANRPVPKVAKTPTTPMRKK
jgi:hypothetical protein